MQIPLFIVIKSLHFSCLLTPHIAVRIKEISSRNDFPRPRFQHTDEVFHAGELV
jgi:hypothetical protein